MKGLGPQLISEGLWDRGFFELFMYIYTIWTLKNVLAIHEVKRFTQRDQYVTGMTGFIHLACLLAGHAGICPAYRPPRRWRGARQGISLPGNRRALEKVPGISDHGAS